MSEPRKINTSGSYGGGRSIHTGAAQHRQPDPRMEEARARARADAEAARMRRSQQFQRVTPQAMQAARMAQPGRQTAYPAQSAPRQVSRPVQQPARPAQPEQQPVRRAVQPGGAQVRHLDLNQTQGSKPAYDINNDPVYLERQRRKAAQAAAMAQAAQAHRAQAQQSGATRQVHRADQPGDTDARAVRQIHRAQPAQTRQPEQQAVTPHPEVARAAAARSGIRMEGAGAASSGRGAAGSNAAGAGGQPPKGPGRSGKAGGDNGGKKGKNGKKKRKGMWWKILLGTILVIALIFGGAAAVIISAIRPSGGGNLTISQLLNTPEGLDGQQLNILVLGIDRSSQGGDMAAGSTNDSEANDGNTDMILYVQLDFVNDEVRMLQIPRNILVTTDYDVSHNYQINNVAITQGSDGNNNYGALAQLINDQLGLYIDGYVAIRLEALVELVDTLGPIQVYVPQEITYTDKNGNVTSHLDQGLQWMDGATAEFFLRARKTYAQSDIQRLNVQRYFYSAMFARLRAMTVWDVAKILPVVMNYMETDLPVSKLVSAAVSLLSVSSDHIMLCQVPVYMGQLFYQENDIDVIYRQGTADLLNTYFRTEETQVPAEQLNICDDVVDVGNREPTDPNVQYMGALNQDVVNAAGESGVETDPNATYDLPSPTVSPSPDASGSEGTDSTENTDGSGSSSSEDDAA